MQQGALKVQGKGQNILYIAENESMQRGRPKKLSFNIFTDLLYLIPNPGTCAFLVASLW